MPDYELSFMSNRKVLAKITCIQKCKKRQHITSKASFEQSTFGLLSRYCGLFGFKWLRPCDITLLLTLGVEDDRSRRWANDGVIERGLVLLKI